MILMDFIEKWRMKLFGRGIQTFKVEEYDVVTGRVLTLRNVGKPKRRANSIIETWDAKGDEIKANPVNFITDDHVIEPAFIACGGITIDLFVTPTSLPNREQIIGKFATLDDLADAMDLGKSVKNYIIGGLISAPVWWLVFQFIGAFAK
jgi:hypothetical protein